MSALFWLFVIVCVAVAAWTLNSWLLDREITKLNKKLDKLLADGKRLRAERDARQAEIRLTEDEL